MIEVVAKVGTVPHGRITLNCDRVEKGQRVEWRVNDDAKWETAIITEVWGDPRKPDRVFLDRH